MTAKNIYLLLAREISTDSNDSMNSIIKIIEKFGTSLDSKKLRQDKVDVEKTPIAVPYKYSVGSSWLFDEFIPKGSSIRLIIEFFDPNEKNLGSIQQENVLPKKVDRLSLNLNLDVFPVTYAGKYSLKGTLFLDEKKLATADYTYEVEIQWIKDDGRD